MKKIIPALSVLLALALTTEVGHTAGTLEEIVVTAQKRSENLMDVPISIAAFSGVTLERSNISSVDDLQTIVPGVEFRKQVSAFTPFIRGIGAQNSSIGTEASVAIYVDGVYQSLPVANAMGFNNLARIEVLKGPQGTLFGRNATGGAISVYTKDPLHETSGKVKIGYDNYDTSKIDLYATTGITDNLAGDVAVQYSDQSEGYFHNVVHNTDVGKERAVSARSKLLWTPTEQTELRFSVSLVETEGGLGVHRKLAPGTRDIAGNLAIDDLRTSQQNYIVGINTGNSQFDGKDMALNSEGATLRIDHDFGSYSLVSISGYLDQESFYIVDQDVGPAPLLDIPLSHFNEQYSQELQLLSNNDGAFNWITGLYYMNAKHRYDPLRIAGLAFAPLLSLDIRNTAETSTFAVFAEGNYEISSRTKLTAGIRWTDDKKSLDGVTEFVIAADNISSVFYSEEKTWSEPTWRIVLDHQITDELMGYVSYSRGFKAGSFNGVVTSGVPGEPVNPEILDAFEIGAKGQFFDDSVALTAAAFYYEFDDMQVSQNIPGGSIQSNAASSKIMGAEINGQFAFGDGWHLRAGVAFTDTEFVDFPNGPASIPNPAGGNTLFAADLTGNEIPRTPKWTANIALDYSVDTHFGSIVSNLTFYHNDGFYWEVDNRLEQEAYSLFGAQITWTDLSENYGVELWVKNLTDEDYSVFSVSEATNDGYAPAAPRLYGLNLFVNF